METNPLEANSQSVSQPHKKFPVIYEREGSLLCLEESIIGSYP
jgi:hypothetical protein